MVFLLFITLQITEVLLAVGIFREAHGSTPWITHAGGWAGIVTAAVAWYASAALVLQGIADRTMLSIGRPLSAGNVLPTRRRVGLPARAG